MSDESKGLVGGTAGLNPSKLFEATRTMFQGAAPSHNKPVSTGVACPRCKEQGVLLNPVRTTDRGFECSMGHQYRDNDELLSMPHDTVPVSQPKTIQPNQVNVQFPVPSSVLQALQAKYGTDMDKMKATFAALAQHMVEPNTLIIGEVDLRRMGDACGMPIRTPAELYGIIKGQQQMIADLQEAAKESEKHGGSAAASGGGTQLRRGELILWFDPPTTASLSEKAKAQNTRLEDFLEAFIKQGEENSWF